MPGLCVEELPKYEDQLVHDYKMGNNSEPDQLKISKILLSVFYLKFWHL